MIVQTTVPDEVTTPMPHFSRLTDIVTCNLTEILQMSQDPAKTLQEIIQEMDEGLSACRRSVATSSGNYERLSKEISAHTEQVADWIQQARQSLAGGNEAAARAALTRKVELEGLIDGLKPEMDAAYSTFQHMLRIQRALEARQSDAARRLAELSGKEPMESVNSEQTVGDGSAASRQKSDEIDAALEALRKELGEPN
jgi:phage shock protein A